VDKKKNKRKNNKKKNKQGSKIPATIRHIEKKPVTIDHVGSVDDVKITEITRKPKYPCRICKGKHLLKDFPSLSKVIEACSTHPREPMSSAFEQHVGDLPSTSHNIVGKKKSRVKFPCILCKGSHITHLFPCMDEASKLLEDITSSEAQLRPAYHKLILDPPVVDGMVNSAPSFSNLVDHVLNMVTSLVEIFDEVVDPVPSSVDPTIPLESETQPFDPFLPIYPILPLENATQVVDLISSSVDPTLSLESKPDTAHIFLIDTESTVLVGIPPSPLKLPPRIEAILFNWGVLIGPHLPSHIPFHITVQVGGRDIPHMFIDEGASISIFSYIAWKALGCPQLASVRKNMLSFNRRTSQPLGTLPEFPITLGGKIVFIDVMVVQDSLDFALLLRRDYFYAMKYIVSTLFRVISFPHDGRIVTFDQISFIDLDWIASLNGSYMQSVSPLPQVNYVALSPMPLVVDADEPPTVSSLPYELDPVVDMVMSSVVILEPDLITPIAALDMGSFHNVFLPLPSSEYLCEAMTEFCPLT
jgi:hypothetical protein